MILVGHSMGGIIIRNTMYLVQRYGGNFSMPSDIGYVTDAVTFNTPHAGVQAAEGGWLSCGGCTQVNQLTEGSTLMDDLSSDTGQNPQTSAGFTQWTVVGSECDQLVNVPGNPDGAAGAIAMQASHAIMYSNQDSATCYNHTGALGDSSTANDATLYYCDATTVLGCGTNYEDSNGNAVPGWTLTTSGSHGLQTLYGSVGR